MPLSDEIQNFTEVLVEEEIDELGIADTHDHDYVQDLFCLVLNKMPPHYVRHSVDVRINMSYEERKALSAKILKAVAEAREILDHDPREAGRIA